MCHVTLNMPPLEVLHHVWDRTATVNLHTKFEVPRFIRSKEGSGDRAQKSRLYVILTTSI